MLRKRERQLLIGGILGTAVLGLVVMLRVPMEQLKGRVLEEDSFQLMQYRSDFDRDGDVDFLDFTVFSSFYEETS